MFQNEITFDRFVRASFMLILAAVGIYLLHYLSGVLVPFFVAWVLAYMLDPLVTFIQHRLCIRSRGVSVLIIFILLFVLVGGILWFVIPTIIHEAVHLKNVLRLYLVKGAANSTIPASVEYFLQNQLQNATLEAWLQGDKLTNILKETIPGVWSVVWKTANVIISIISSLISLLYLFFILLDYEKISLGWLRFVPKSKREFVKGLADDVNEGMNSYFRGQALVALSVGILFSIGFLLIDFPMAIVLGLMIGLLNLVPYLQLIGFVPTLILALLKAADTGENFWLILGSALLVFAVVQALQDLWITPRIMGHIMGLSPTVILLSLSVWGYLLGLIGLIIALPLTTLLISYYKRYIVTDDLELQSPPRVVSPTPTDD